MSLLSMLKSIFRTSKRPEALHIISITFQDGGEVYACQAYLPQRAEDMLEEGQHPSSVGIWRRYGQPFAIGQESTAQSLSFLRSYSPTSQSPAKGGYLVTRQDGSEWLV